MNNSQFRKLLLANSAKSTNGDDKLPSSTRADAGSLGSRKHASIPMTPRSVGGSNASFAKQLADRNNADNPSKRFKSSTPRGIRLATGYTDRSRERDDATQDDRSARINALEESLKKGDIDRETFDKLTVQIAGGELESTHLVKGLDFKLLERVRRGEDVYSERTTSTEPNTLSEEPEPEDAADDLDEEFSNLEKQDVQEVHKDHKEKKKGELASVSLAPGKKRTRDQILADFKSSRAKAQAEALLNARFSKIGAKKTPGSRIEVDNRGREVLIIIDADGHEKRKVRKAGNMSEAEQRAKSGLLFPDEAAKPLGMEVPEHLQKKPEPEIVEDVDIFDDVGDDYDPLAGMDNSGTESDSEDDVVPSKEPQGESSGEEALSDPIEEGLATPSEAPPKQVLPPKRNYFKDSKVGLVSEEMRAAPSMSDPAITAAIKRAAAMNLKPILDNEESTEEAEARRAKEERHKKLLQSGDRDEEDLDMGFGTSRFEDEEDVDENKVKLSAWGDEREGRGGGRDGQGKRKRGPKKRRGDGNNADDVLRVMAERKKT